MLSRRTQPLSRSPMPARPQPLRRASPGLCATKRQQRQQYRQAAEVAFCAACGSGQRLEHSHCLTQKMFPQHRNNMANVLTLCSDCHRCWENNKAGFKAAFPAAWAVKMGIMEALEPGYFALFQLKNKDLF